MILPNKKILVMGIRNRQSIAWHIAKTAVEQGTQVFFTYSTFEKEELMQELMEELGAKRCVCDVASDSSIPLPFGKPLKENTH